MYATADNRLGQRLLLGYVWLVSAFLMAPIAVAVVLSFSSVSQLEFPPPGLSLDWYRVAWDNDKFVNGFIVSTAIAAISSTIAGIAGTFAAVAINNYRFFGRAAIQSLVIMPLIIPAVVIGLGLLQALSTFGLRPGILAASLGHSVMGIPYVVYLVLAALSGYDIRLEHAAQSLGASRLRTFLDVTFPVVRPGMVAGIAFAFLMSFDNVAMSIFLARGDPLPLRLMQHIQYYADPSVAAVSTVLLAISLVALVLFGRMLRKRDVGNLA
jgi:putative spermidine/putrescine transport system permease protein